jgi:hypothetical protein
MLTAALREIGLPQTSANVSSQARAKRAMPKRSRTIFCPSLPMCRASLRPWSKKRIGSMSLPGSVSMKPLRPFFDHGHQLRGCQAHDRHAEHHRFEQRQP